MGVVVCVVVVCVVVVCVVVVGVVVVGGSSGTTNPDGQDFDSGRRACIKTYLARSLRRT